MSKYILIFLSFLLIATSCKQEAKPSKIEKESTASESTKLDNPRPLPKWASQANIYEVNIRQYTPEGTFDSFAKH